MLVDLYSWVGCYLEESLGLGDHGGQALGRSQVLTQVALVRAAQAELPAAAKAEGSSSEGHACQAADRNQMQVELKESQ